jgi:hypothetical protein
MGDDAPLLDFLFGFLMCLTTGGEYELTALPAAGATD